MRQNLEKAPGLTLGDALVRVGPEGLRLKLPPESGLVRRLVQAQQ